MFDLAAWRDSKISGFENLTGLANLTGLEKPSRKPSDEEGVPDCSSYAYITSRMAYMPQAIPMRAVILRKAGWPFSLPVLPTLT